MTRKDSEPQAQRTCAICDAPLSSREGDVCTACLKKSEAQRTRHFRRPVGGPRTPFGTRVATAITCAECGRRDHIGFRPRPGARTLCRSCAEKILDRYEHGSRRPQTSVRIRCSSCGREDDLPSRLADIEDPLCHDCLRGIYSNQTERIRSAEPRKSGTLLSRRSRQDED